jgi:hypothetical protein
MGFDVEKAGGGLTVTVLHPDCFFIIRFFQVVQAGVEIQAVRGDGDFLAIGKSPLQSSTIFTSA